MSKRLICGLLATITLSLGVASLAAAQTLKVAVVDIDAVSARYKELVDRQQELGAWVQDKKSFLNSMQDFMFVAAEEFQEAARIYNVPKAQWNDQQKKREGELRGISTGNEKKYLELQANPNRTPEQQNQYNTLRDIVSAREMDLKQISRTFDEQLKKNRDEVQTKLVSKVRTVIEDLAKSKGFSLVLDKSAAYFAVAPVEDLTEDVLKGLNAGAPAPAPAPAAAPAGAAGAGK